MGTYLYGRRLYEVMLAWETFPLEEQPEYIRDYARIWRAVDKVVYSTALEMPSSARTRLERAFDPNVVRGMKESADRDLSVGGPGVAAHAFRAGLVDELHLFLAPVMVGGGTRSLPDGVRLDLELVDERRFGSGFAYLRYRARS